MKDTTIRAAPSTTRAPTTTSAPDETLPVTGLASEQRQSFGMGGVALILLGGAAAFGELTKSR